MPKAILLDMDDTIIAFDHGVDTDECWKKSIRNHIPGIDTNGELELLSNIKEWAKWYWNDPERHRVGRLDLLKARQGIVETALMRSGQNDLCLANSIAATYGEERDQVIVLFPDSNETIKLFRAKGIKLALLTNGNAEMQWNKIRRFGLASFFDCILVEGDLGIGKPDERIYLHALERLGVSAEETWMVGDNFDWEVEAPQRLGIKGIWIDHKGKGVPVNASTKPFMTIKSLSDLISVI